MDDNAKVEESSTEMSVMGFQTSRPPFGDKHRTLMQELEELDNQFPQTANMLRRVHSLLEKYRL